MVKSRVPFLSEYWYRQGTFMESANSDAEVENANPGIHGDSTPAALLPSQYFGSICARTFSSEQRLMLAVLVDAINLVLRGNRDRNRSASQEASSWIFASGVARWLSFDLACDAIGLNPEWLRKRLVELLSQRGNLRKLMIREQGRGLAVTFNAPRRR
jgi:hypothetical protein